jgi:hypothetical protein
MNDIVILNFNFVLMRDSVLKKPDAKYILMNEETYKYLLDHSAFFINRFGYTTFYGVPVAICNYKKTGEIEIV